MFSWALAMCWTLVLGPGDTGISMTRLPPGWGGKQTRKHTCALDLRKTRTKGEGVALAPMEELPALQLRFISPLASHTVLEDEDACTGR